MKNEAVTDDGSTPRIYALSSIKEACFRRLPGYRESRLALPELLKKVAIDMFTYGDSGDELLARSVRYHLKELDKVGILRDPSTKDQLVLFGDGEG